MECVECASCAPAIEATPNALRTFYRWGWLPLVGGCVVLAAAEIAAWEVILGALGMQATNTEQRWLYVARAVTTSIVLALFVGWYVLATRQKLEAEREALHREEARLGEEARRLEVVAGRAAMLRLVGHELHNPLNGLLLHCRALRKAMSALPAEQRDDAQLAVDVVEAEARRVSALVDEYKARGHAEKMTLVESPVSLFRLARAVIGELEPEIREKSIGVTIDAPDGLAETMGDRGLLAVAVHHVVRNALEAVERGGQIHISASSTPKEILLDVCDDGPGFADLSAALRPFYSTKSDGFGMGLTIARDVVRAHSGTIGVCNGGSLGGGCVRIRLPVVSA